MAEMIRQRLVGIDNYMSYFSDGYPPRKAGNVRVSADYSKFVDDETYNRFRELGGDEYEIDTTLEWVLSSYYSSAVIKARPVHTDAILPANNPKLADTKLGAAVFQEIQILQFLGNTAAVGRHEGVLKFITDRKNVTRAEVEAYYRNGIRSLISDTVDEEFNKISFSLDVPGKGSYNTILKRNPQTGEYILSYERPSVQNSRKELSAASLDALLSKMLNDNEYKTDFDETGINAVKAQAALIPAVALSDTALDEVKTILTNFYITPSATTYNAVKEVHTLFIDKRVATGKVIYWLALLDYVGVLVGLNEGLARKVADDKNNSVTALSADQQKRLVQLR